MKGITTPQGRDALERFKMESANEVGVTLKQGYNGDLTSQQAGSIGGRMVKKISPEHRLKYSRNNCTVLNHKQEITYVLDIAI